MTLLVLSLATGLAGTFNGSTPAAAPRRICKSSATLTELNNNLGKIAQCLGKTVERFLLVDIAPEHGQEKVGLAAAACLVASSVTHDCVERRQRKARLRQEPSAYDPPTLKQLRADLEATPSRLRSNSKQGRSPRLISAHKRKKRHPPAYYQSNTLL
ncbi:uncharacterized protein M421DRAFT_281714 [Didymella exigua CBS 183.55]|uniref:Fungal N-terminal domain-containing protein n=1 Tax=Didymella exigua CBS 183.55 TaxID=1150837 RepID=A0A6A5RBE9_9PLEO|nr:uncharacterized protein M421DRAFT_281714 [Didymella exigua CBS 183.55]KAF1924394.1 hypothetical protein M421DRAFT_281714 [Didymella exigua CBS 183.55]